MSVTQTEKDLNQYFEMMNSAKLMKSKLLEYV